MLIVDFFRVSANQRAFYKLSFKDEALYVPFDSKAQKMVSDFINPRNERGIFYFDEQAGDVFSEDLKKFGDTVISISSDISSKWNTSFIYGINAGVFGEVKSKEESLSSVLGTQLDDEGKGEIVSFLADAFVDYCLKEYELQIPSADIAEITTFNVAIPRAMMKLFINILAAVTSSDHPPFSLRTSL